MKIRINLNDTRTIDNAIKRFELAQKQLETKMISELLFSCALEIAKLADRNLDFFGIGENVKEEIKEGWTTEKISNEHLILKNKSNKSVYVEFGVGIVGQENPHIKAIETKYEYNIPTVYKRAGKYHDDNTWRFYKDDESEVDLQDGYFEVWNTSKGTIKVITRGSPATMFVYNAIVEFKERRLAKEIWEKIKAKYWG